MLFSSCSSEETDSKWRDAGWGPWNGRADLFFGVPPLPPQDFAVKLLCCMDLGRRGYSKLVSALGLTPKIFSAKELRADLWRFFGSRKCKNLSALKLSSFA
jgi:hypothetical protein